LNTPFQDLLLGTVWSMPPILGHNIEGFGGSEIVMGCCSPNFGPNF